MQRGCTVDSASCSLGPACTQQEQELGLARCCPASPHEDLRWKTRQAGQRNAQQDTSVGWHGHDAQPEQQKEASAQLRCDASPHFHIQGNVN